MLGRERGLLKTTGTKDTGSRTSIAGPLGFYFGAREPATP